MVVTKAGRLPCKFVFHLAPKRDQKSWKVVLEHCFVEAEKLQMTSLVLPPVGTGCIQLLLLLVMTNCLLQTALLHGLGIHYNQIKSINQSVNIVIS